MRARIVRDVTSRRRRKVAVRWLWCEKPRSAATAANDPSPSAREPAYAPAGLPLGSSETK